MAAPTVAEFKARFSGVGQSDTEIENSINDANDLIGGAGEKAVMYAAAHIISLGSGEAVDSGDGEVTSTTIGSRSESYQTMAERGNDTFWTTTRYGRMALKLARSSFAPLAPVIG